MAFQDGSRSLKPGKGDVSHDALAICEMEAVSEITGIVPIAVKVEVKVDCGMIVYSQNAHDGFIIKIDHVIEGDVISHD